MLRPLFDPENPLQAANHPRRKHKAPNIVRTNARAGAENWIVWDGVTPFFQIPRIVVPAGMSDVIHEPDCALSEDATDYVSILPPGLRQTRMPHAMPIAMTFFRTRARNRC
jgi:hypothetical protein